MRDDPSSATPIDGRRSTETSDPVADGEGLGRGYAASLAGGLVEVLAAAFIGWATARFMGASGKGEYTMVVTWVLLAGWLGSVGLAEAATYHATRAPRLFGSIASTTILWVGGLGAVAVGVVNLLLPVGFAAQRDEVIEVARVASLGVFAVAAFQGVEGLLLARRRFVALNAISSSHYVAVAVAFAVAGIAFELELWVALTVKFTFLAAVVVIGFWVALRGRRLARPDLAQSRSMLSFGARLQLHGLGELGSAQLDLAVLPAFVIAADVGVYAVSASAATVIIVVMDRIGRLVLTHAVALAPDERARLIEASFRIVAFLATATAVVIFFAAEPLLPALYGEEFERSVAPLRILLPGVVAWSLNRVASAGLQASSLPGLTSVSMSVSLGLTCVGLAVLLHPLGIVGAAITSSIAYATGLVVSIVFLVRRCGVAAHALVAFTALRDDLRELRRSIG